MERTSTQFDAVYENGVLRPLNPVDLPEHERLSVIVNLPADPLADVLDWEAHELGQPKVTKVFHWKMCRRPCRRYRDPWPMWCPQSATNDR